MTAPRIVTVRSSTLLDGPTTLDAKHYQEEFVLARNRVKGSGYQIRKVADLATAFVPPRIKLVTGTTASAGPAYLKAHDAFDTLPTTNRYLATARLKNADQYMLQEGMLLTPSSGRNLGPLAYVGKFLSMFAMTDIMRIVPYDKEVGMFLLAFLMRTRVKHLSDVGELGPRWTSFSQRCTQHSRAVGGPIYERALCHQFTDRGVPPGRELVDLESVQREIHSMAGLPGNGGNAKEWGNRAKVFSRLATLMRQLRSYS